MVKDITKFDSILEIADYFKDQETCKKHLEQLRWGNNIVCPHCSHENAYRTTVGYKCSSNKCYKKFSVVTKTIFEGTKIPLRKWFMAIFTFINNSAGISSVTLSKELKITQHSAWFLLHRLREIMRSATPKKLFGTVQADETMFGGKESNKPKSKRAKKAKGSSLIGTTKTYIIGAVQQDGNIITTLSDSNAEDVLIPFLKDNVEEGATIVTDAHRGYQNLPNHNYTHITNKHGKHKFVRVVDDVKYHTQAIEGFWSIFKGAVKGTHRYISLKHLSKYTAEHTCRYNLRKKKPADKFIGLLGMVSNTTVKYEKMIAGKYRSQD
ncbi:IS1595 family transposase [Taibaiella sp. KBW10]|uniref:IS1595 family transposase n=1 Tax=Taibaiella sp. KBW10 TaxID=2153357 RepID=UPI0013150B0D|nr:IS1595 family transposase [Taibaiella sp. KBW10]